MFLISDLCKMLESYLDKAGVEKVYRAYLFGAEAHEGQTRMSGEPYIYHPIAVARILCEMHMDADTIVAAILHDVIEDTPIAKQQIAEEFGQEIAEIVDGVTKLDHIQFNNKAEAKAESFRKMVLAMVRDIRVILIKLADRLHNMRTLGVMRPEKARRIASETLEVYAPIANRLGMNNLRHELENLGFKAYNPLRFRVLEETVQKAGGNRKEIVQKIQNTITDRLHDDGLPGEVLGREKHLYSIYKKMRKKHLPFSEVNDVYAFRIIVGNVDECYRVLGIVHNLYKPVPGKFKDYIAIPKANGYQSLHTILFSPYGVPIEVQIRTAEMHSVAEQGIAAHWAYKNDEEHGGALTKTKAREWLKNLLELQQTAGDSMEFLENVKIDLFPDEVYVFSPKGEIFELPRGATPVDFAYTVHTDVGSACVAAKIDRRLAPLSSVLSNGQTVEIITAQGARPNPGWLSFVATGKARSNIRNALKNMQSEESIALGRRLMNKCLSNLGLSLDTVSQSRINRMLEVYQIDNLDKLLEDVGLGNRIPQLVTRTLMPEAEHEEIPVSAGEGRPLAIKGTEGMVVSYAKCCHPIPGDNIMGFISSGRGIVIHVEGCNNIAEYKDRPEKWVNVQWSEELSGEFSVSIRILAQHQRGALATIASAIAEMDANIEHVDTVEQEDNLYALDLNISVHDRDHLAAIIYKLRELEMVVKIQRVK